MSRAAWGGERGVAGAAWGGEQREHDGVGRGSARGAAALRAGRLGTAGPPEGRGVEEHLDRIRQWGTTACQVGPTCKRWQT